MRQKFYVVTYGDKIYSKVFTKLCDAEKERNSLLAQGKEVKIKVAYKD